MAPKIFGILNVTEDSFSDGGKYLATEQALAHARAMSDADVLDIGAAASNPDAISIPSDVEIARLEPVIASLRQEGRSISIDTFSPDVQRWAVAQNVDYINDIRGFPNSDIYPALAAASTKLIVMHSIQRGPATRHDVSPDAVFDSVVAFFRARIAVLTAAGVDCSRLILDPGMGFFLGSNPDASFAMLNALPQLKALFGLPVFISVSRKSFLRALTGKQAKEAGPATLAAELYAAEHGADFIRTHDPAALKDALLVRERLSAGAVGTPEFLD